MARHGNSKAQKRISINKSVHVHRKENVWIVKANPGPHSGGDSVALGVVLRDILKIARNLREVKLILNKRTVSVDGVIRTEKKFPVGLFDVIALADLKKQFRVLLDGKARFVLKEIPAKSSGFKLVKVSGKKIVKGKRIQLGTNDGRIFGIDAKEKISVGDTLKISLPAQKILETFSFEKGNTGFVFRGERIGGIAEIENILEGTMKRGKLVMLKPKEGEPFQTVAGNVFIVGKKNIEIEL
ncbi:MAG: 30S ribosomal protein S4e [Candidatus ainarchaeum sp.]|nr:30S ribosomal protein S4e [Candidatus ainarchaeum sp.]